MNGSHFFNVALYPSVSAAFTRTIHSSGLRPYGIRKRRPTTKTYHKMMVIFVLANVNLFCLLLRLRARRNEIDCAAGSQIADRPWRLRMLHAEIGQERGGEIFRRGAGGARMLD